MQQIEITCDCGKKSYADSSALGEEFRCPHCGQTHQLPGTVTESEGTQGDVEEEIEALEEVQEDPPPKQAIKEVREEEFSVMGLESKVDAMGTFFLIVGGLCACVGGIGFTTQITHNETLAIYFLVIGVVGLVQGIALGLLFTVAAEILRLLKKLNHLPYTGLVSGGTRIRKGYVCSECGLLFASSWIEQCPHCRSVFVESKN